MKRRNKLPAKNRRPVEEENSGVDTDSSCSSSSETESDSDTESDPDSGSDSQVSQSSQSDPGYTSRQSGSSSRSSDGLNWNSGEPLGCLSILFSCNGLEDRWIHHTTKDLPLRQSPPVIHPNKPLALVPLDGYNTYVVDCSSSNSTPKLLSLPRDPNCQPPIAKGD